MTVPWGHASRRFTSQRWVEAELPRLDFNIELNENDVPDVNCTGLEPLGVADCPFDENVKFRVHYDNGTDTSYGYSCRTYANRDRTCIVTMNDVGVQGLWFNEKHTVSFNIANGVSDIDINPTIIGCGTDDLSSETPDSQIAVPDRRLSWQEATWLTKWTDCYTGDDTTTNVFMGLAVGSELVKSLGSVSNVKSWLEAIVSEANTVYMAQLNIKLHVTEVEIVAKSGAQSFDNPGCKRDFSPSFDTFTKWTRPPGSSVALWHYFDDCHKVGDTAIGVAYIGTLCNPQWNTGMTYYSGRTWLTFAHEVGHNFGARHSFEDGKGTTGGIMDYGDKTLNNEYQFNTKYRKKEMCASMDRAFSNSECVGKIDLNPQGKCGNGVLETNEECECPKGTDCSCCKDCKLKSGAQCSPHFGTECCLDNCQYADTKTTCFRSNGPGYCRIGICEDAGCGSYGLGPFCGVHDDNPCKRKCEYAGVCRTMDGWTSGGKPINYMRDGIPCSTPTISGKCKSGECIGSPTTPSPTPNPTPLPTPGQNPTPSPTPEPTQKCLAEGNKCLKDPESCCEGLRCPVEEYEAGLINKRKVKCIPAETEICLGEGDKCLDNPDACCGGLRCPMEEYSTGFLNKKKVKCVSEETEICLDKGKRCFDYPDACCSGYRCPVDEYESGLINKKKRVKCIPAETEICLGKGKRCFDNPEACCGDLRCPMDEYNAGLIKKKKRVRCTM